MDLLKRLFRGKNAVSERAVAADDDVNPAHEQHLKDEFGLDYGREGWAFEGGKIINDLAQQLRKPEICLGVLTKIRTELPFTQVCIVGGNNVVVLVCNTKPTPTCFVSGLNASGIGSLVAMSVKQGGHVSIYRGTWLLTL